MKHLLPVLIVTALLVISCDFSPKPVLKPPFDTVIPPTDTLLAAPKLVSEGYYELSPWEGDSDVPLFRWDGEGEAPVKYSRVSEGNDMKIWMSVYVFSNESEAHTFFDNSSNGLRDLYNITQDYMRWIEDNGEAIRWYYYDYPNWEYEDGSVSQGVVFRVRQYVGHFQMEDTKPFIVPSAWATPPIVPRGEVDSTFWDAIDYTIVHLRSLR